MPPIRLVPTTPVDAATSDASAVTSGGREGPSPAPMPALQFNQLEYRDSGKGNGQHAVAQGQVGNRERDDVDEPCPLLTLEEFLGEPSNASLAESFPTPKRSPTAHGIGEWHSEVTQALHRRIWFLEQMNAQLVRRRVPAPQATVPQQRQQALLDGSPESMLERLSCVAAEMDSCRARLSELKLQRQALEESLRKADPNLALPRTVSHSDTDSGGPSVNEELLFYMNRAEAAEDERDELRRALQVVEDSLNRTKTALREQTQQAQSRDVIVQAELQSLRAEKRKALEELQESRAMSRSPSRDRAGADACMRAGSASPGTESRSDGVFLADPGSASSLKADSEIPICSEISGKLPTGSRGRGWGRARGAAKASGTRRRHPAEVS